MEKFSVSKILNSVSDLHLSLFHPLATVGAQDVSRT